MAGMFSVDLHCRIYIVGSTMIFSRGARAKINFP